MIDARLVPHPFLWREVCALVERFFVERVGNARRLMDHE
ncbi:hypothetical protein CLV97_103129 [Planifilum fimeticola]|uniref:Uncharacterized protein n=1 Tax=Planifilum fimeticola TaxID=201975 RepID=A0A2T0LI69_9BACL|nr:hypothetical protein CLV97_103129 [Planifilum fimeticola]